MNSKIKPVHKPLNESVKTGSLKRVFNRDDDEEDTSMAVGNFVRQYFSKKTFVSRPLSPESLAALHDEPQASIPPLDLNDSKTESSVKEDEKPQTEDKEKESKKDKVEKKHHKKDKKEEKKVHEHKHKSKEGHKHSHKSKAN